MTVRQMLGKVKKPAVWTALVAVMVCVVAAVCFLAAPGKEVREQTFDEPPAMRITAGEKTVTAKLGWHEWVCTDENGETVTKIVDDFLLTELVYELPELMLNAGTEASVRFDLTPDSMTVVCWPVGSTAEDSQAVQVTGVERIALLDGDYVYSVRVQWNDRGSAKYAFVATTSPGGMLAKPPELCIFTADGQSVKTLQGSYDWWYERKGETVQLKNVALPVAQTEDLPGLPAIYDSGEGNTVRLDFGLTPDSISVSCWEAEDPDGAALVYTECDVSSFDLQRGNWIYLVSASWQDHGSAQYAFTGSYYALRLEEAEPLEVLREKYPQYLTCTDGKGLELYIWRTGPDSFACGLMSGTNRCKTEEEILELEGATIAEMRAILLNFYGRGNREGVMLISYDRPDCKYSMKGIDADALFWGAAK